MGFVKKFVKKVVKGVVKVVKKVVKSIGKVVSKISEKLGPIGMIAVSLIAPAAIGWMASSNVGWVSTLGKALQGVGQAISAPFKAITSVGQNLLGSAMQGAGKVATTLFGESNPISNMLFEAGNSLLTKSGAGAWSPFEAGKETLSTAWKGATDTFAAMQDDFATAVNGPSPDYGFEGPQQLPENVGRISADTGDLTLMPEGDQIFDPTKMTGADQIETTFMGSETTQAAGADAFSGALDMAGEGGLESASNYYSPQYDDTLMGSLGATNAPASKEMIGFEGDPLQYGATEFKGYTSQDLVNSPYDTSVKDSSSLLNKDLMKKIGSSLLGGPDAGSLLSSLNSESSTSGYEPSASDALKGSGEYGSGDNFYVINSQGAITSDEGQTGVRSGSTLASLLQQQLGKNIRSGAYA